MIVIVLDYLYLGRFPSCSELGRQPSELQERTFSRLYALVAASGSRREQLPVVPGRSGPELIACLDVLEKFLHEHPSFGGGYGFQGPVKVKSSKKDDAERIAKFPQLHPFRSLDVQAAEDCRYWTLAPLRLPRE